MTSINTTTEWDALMELAIHFVDLGDIRAKIGADGRAYLDYVPVVAVL